MPRRYARPMERRRVIRLPAAMDAALTVLAQERGLTVSELVREAVARCFILPTVVPSRNETFFDGTTTEPAEVLR